MGWLEVTLLSVNLDQSWLVLQVLKNTTIIIFVISIIATVAVKFSK